MTDITTIAMRVFVVFSVAVRRVFVMIHLIAQEVCKQRRVAQSRIEAHVWYSSFKVSTVRCLVCLECCVHFLAQDVQLAQ